MDSVTHKPKGDLKLLAGVLAERLEILVICLSHSWGGLEQVAAQDARELLSLGIKVRLMCLEGSPIHQKLAATGEIPLVVLPFRPRNAFDLKLRAVLLQQFAQGVNLVHTHQTSILASIVPWVWTRPEISVFASRHIMNNHDKRTFFHRSIYSRLDALIVMSQSLRQNVLATHPLKDRQVRIVNLGLDFKVFDPERVDGERFRRSWGADADTTVVGLVGRIDPAKGQATFIKAAAGLIKRVKPGEQLKFVIVGEQTLGGASTHLAELEEMVRQFRLESQVVFAGFQEDIPGIMAAFDILVMPSKQEAFGLVAIEAMAMECPVVLSRAGSAEEITGQQQYGLLMRPDDAFDLQHRLRYLIDNKEERLKMGRRARDFVLEHYDRKLRLQRTLELYERALRRRRVS